MQGFKHSDPLEIPEKLINIIINNANNINIRNIKSKKNIIKNKV